MWKKQFIRTLMGRTYWHCGAMIFEVFRRDSCDHLEDCRVHGTERVGGMVWLLRVLTTCHSGKMTSVPSSPIATADWRWYCGWSVKSHGQMRFKALLHIWLEPKVGTELLYLPVSDFSITSLSRDMPKKKILHWPVGEIHFTSSPSWQWLAVWSQGRQEWPGSFWGIQLIPWLQGMS